jgi:hypothetical protein
MTSTHTDAALRTLPRTAADPEAALRLSAAGLQAESAGAPLCDSVVHPMRQPRHGASRSPRFRISPSARRIRRSRRADWPNSNACDAEQQGLVARPPT